MLLVVAFAWPWAAARRPRHLRRNLVFSHATSASDRHSHGTRRKHRPCAAAGTTGTLRLAFAGMVVGTFGSRAVARLISSLLFATPSWDLPTYLGMALALLLVAAISGYIPARRASGINPMEVLRSN